ncbi:hypothetical protein SAMN05421670_3609 [Psychrobacillus psychrotolerans]|uniref:Uncharacterized protein n=1 Tax=Psychrobacillus psychrotolerans TaxID=126156 RepID=A0A1I6AU39_9BACI|nr:hypothetical protein SAMN05421670_3609 [Psychrobacillus psychrotolerans]
MIVIEKVKILVTDRRDTASKSLSLLVFHRVIPLMPSIVIERQIPKTVGKSTMKSKPA